MNKEQMEKQLREQTIQHIMKQQNCSKEAAEKIADKMLSKVQIVIA
tara:strand:- start:390 stop:527 length:138 start_codon:yes stop_codon:yes gene_type:complete